MTCNSTEFWYVYRDITRTQHKQQRPRLLRKSSNPGRRTKDRN